MLVALLIALVGLPIIVLYGLSWWFRLKFKHTIDLAESLPNPLPRLPIIGHGYVFFFNPEATLSKMASDALAKGYNTVSLWLGPVPVIVVLGKEDVHKVLASSHSNERPRECINTANSILKEGLFCSTGDRWKIKKKRMNLLFQSKNVESYLSVFYDQSQALVGRLANHVDGPAVDVFEDVTTMTLHSITKFIFGDHFNPSDHPNLLKETSNILKLSENIVFKKSICPWLKVGFMSKLFYTHDMNTIDAGLENLERTYRKKAPATNTSAPTENNNDGQKYDVDKHKFKDNLCLVDVYELYKEEYAEFGQPDFKDVFAEMYLAGSDSLTIAISTCLVLLAQHREVQDKLSEEITSVMGSKDMITMDHIREMSYLDQVYKESLRFTNVVPTIVRQSTRQISLSTCTLPANTPVQNYVGAVSFDPKVYPNPRMFRPERFSNIEGNTRVNMDFFPFSGGAHKCIGYYYSELVYKVTIAQIVRNFRMTTDMDATRMKKSWSFLLRSSNGYKIKIYKRNHIKETKTIG